MPVCKKSQKDIVCVALFIYDNSLIGDSKAISNAITMLKENGIILKIVEGVQDYLTIRTAIYNQKF